ALCAIDVGSCGYLDDADLHPCEWRKAQGNSPAPSSKRAERQKKDVGMMERWSIGVLEGQVQAAITHHSITPPLQFFSCLCFLSLCLIHVAIDNTRDFFVRHLTTNRPVGFSRPLFYLFSRSTPWLGCLSVRRSYRR